MVKTPAEKQKVYLTKLKSRDIEAYLKVERERKKRKLQILKLQKGKYDEHLKEIEKESKKKQGKNGNFLSNHFSVSFRHKYIACVDL